MTICRFPFGDESDAASGRLVTRQLLYHSAEFVKGEQIIVNLTYEQRLDHSTCN